MVTFWGNEAKSVVVLASVTSVARQKAQVVILVLMRFDLLKIAA